mmetsp:Transcript_15856/g.27324  ORF Transcript_15856/g.27324 Transcript_15856/m.27324 type:complete len:442 (+) Transcript_15856:87-1412(+)|eukprot:CAMPEP_0196659032 /NCGR_PEP_ID=MMETSP1086-20130531/32817_1 /TAXON_ID=77921 /ORGANISM="Cyanoptyche  gloeocystis , Strain SAG4.97" /LENGTH=441 /DNA_ID=CAMNT_0041992855 /DNA_START=81 /DNA_END=1406 /DNA_ORIENTATION=-
MDRTEAAFLSSTVLCSGKQLHVPVKAGICVREERLADFSTKEASPKSFLSVKRFTGFRTFSSSTYGYQDAQTKFWSQSASNASNLRMSEEEEPAVQEESAAEAPEKTESKPRQRRPRQPRKKDVISLDTLEVGQELTGTVRGLQAYGAFIDIGAASDGMVHISELTSGFVKDINEVIKVGDTVQVTIKEIDREKSRIALTMLSSADLESKRAAQQEAASRKTDGPRRRSRVQKKKLEEYQDGQQLVGKVTSVMEFGAFIDVGAVTDGLVHISEISADRIDKVSDVLEVGQEVNVRVVGIDNERGRISLSMKSEEERAASVEAARSRRERFADQDHGEDEEEKGDDDMGELAVGTARARRQATERARRMRRQRDSDDDNMEGYGAGSWMDDTPRGMSELGLAIKAAFLKQGIVIPDPPEDEEPEAVATDLVNVEAVEVVSST